MNITFSNLQTRALEARNVTGILSVREALIPFCQNPDDPCVAGVLACHYQAAFDAMSALIQDGNVFDHVEASEDHGKVRVTLRNEDTEESFRHYLTFQQADKLAEELRKASLTSAPKKEGF